MEAHALSGPEGHMRMPITIAIVVTLTSLFAA